MKGRSIVKKKLFIAAGVGLIAAICLVAFNHKREELDSDL